MTVGDTRARPMLPTLDDLNRPFWEGCAAGELRLQACRSCGRIRYPISDACPVCLSPDYQWRTMSGEGEILSWVVFHHGYHPAWRGRTPYNVVLVQLREGPRMIGNVEPLGLTDLSVGAPVRVTFVPAESAAAGSEATPEQRPGLALPRWELV
jgi:uncharacterized OB-fold protein